MLENRIAELEQSISSLNAEACLLDALPEAVVGAGQDLLITYWNRAAAELFDRSAEEALGRPFDCLFRPELPPERVSAIRQALLDTGQYDLELVLVDQNRAERVVKVKGRACKLGDSEEQGFLFSIREITTRRREEEDRERLLAELREERGQSQRLAAQASQRAAELGAIIDSLSDPLILYDREGITRQANQSARQILGFDPIGRARKANLGGMSGWRSGDRALEIDDLPSGRALLGERVEGQLLSFKNRKGQEYFILASASPVFVSGELVGAVSFWRDITELKRSEVELRRANERLQAVLRALPVAVWIASEDGRLIEKNSIVDEVWGGDAPLAEDISQYRAYRGWWAEGGIELRADDWALARALRSGDTLTGEVINILRFDGSMGTIVNNAAPILDENGNVSGAVAVAMDITRQEQLLAENERQRALLQHQRRRLEQALFEARQSRAKMAGILESIQDGFFALDRDWRFTYANRLAVQFSDLPAEELLGKHLLEVWPQLRGTLAEEYYHRVREQGKPVQFRFKEPVEDLWFDVTVYPSSDGISVFFVDRTDQIKTEAALRESEIRFRTLVESMDDIVFTLDREGRYTGMYGRALQNDDSVQELFLGHTAEEVFEPGFGVAPADANRRSLAGEQVVYEWSSAQPGMDAVHYQIRLSPLLSPEGEVVGSVGVGRDITPMKRAEEELRQFAEKLARSNRELEEFAFVASHDLQEPLRKIEAFGERLQEVSAGKLDEKETLFLERMLAASGRMQAMIDGLLAYSRVTTKAQPFSKVDLGQIAREVLSDLETRLERAGGRVELGDLPVIEADPLQMRQLFQNLLGNALKFHKPDEPPLVRVWSRPQDIGARPGVEILFADNGIGFDLKHLERMFIPFERLTGRSEFEGSGMGLAICQKIAERHGGRITAEGASGEGATFRVVLPIRQAS